MILRIFPGLWAIGVGLLMLFSPTAALADANLNCDAYAAAAVKQAIENKQRSCNYKGSLWSSSYNGHKNWCLLASTKMANLTWGDRERARLLEICNVQKGKKHDRHRAKEKLCLRLAREKRVLQKQVKKSCGTGSWPASLKQDVDHCMKIGGAGQVQANTKLRNKRRECDKAGATKTFSPPRGGSGYSNRPIDVCIDLKGLFCAKGLAANQFCKWKGYKKAASWKHNTTTHTVHIRCVTSGKKGRICFCNGTCGYVKKVVCQGKRF